MTRRRRSPLFALGLSFKRSLLFGVGIASGSIITLAVFEWKGLAALGFSGENTRSAYLIVAGVAVLLSLGLFEVKLLYHGWLRPYQENQENSRWQRERIALETEVVNLRNEYATITAELEASQRDLEDVQGNVTIIGTDLERLERGVTEETRHLRILRQTSAARHQEVNSLEARIWELRQQQNEAQSTIQAATKSQEQIGQLQTAVETLTGKREILETQGPRKQVSQLPNTVLER